MRPRSLFAAILFTLLGASYSSRAQTVTGTAAIAGRVTDAQTAEPLSGVTVRLLPMRSQNGGRTASNTISQSDGSFHFDALGAGTYMLRGERAGYLTTSRFSRGDRIQLANGQFLNDLALKLTPESKISGRVYDDTGQPVAGAHVRALQKSIYSGTIQLEDRSSGDSGQDGAFSIRRLRPGKYILVADPPQTTQAASSPDGDLVRTMFPHAVDVNDAEEIEIAAGYSPSDVKLYLKRSAAHHIRGRLGDGVSVSRRVNLLLSPRVTGTSITLARTVAVAKDGRFDAGGVVAGSYILRAIGGRRDQLLGRAEVDITAADVNNVVVAALPAVIVSGTVRVDGGELADVGAYVRVVARPLLDDYASPLVAQVGSDGIFRFTELEPEEWLFSAVPGASGFYVKALLSSGQDVRGRPIDLSEFPAINLEVVLHNGAATISGTVEVSPDDDPSGISVALVPKQVDAIGSNVQFKSTQKNGTFAFGNLAPDDYTLYAVQRADVDVWQNSGFLQQIAPEGAAITVAEGQQQQAQLKLIPYEQIAQAALRAGVPED